MLLNIQNGYKPLHKDIILTFQVTFVSPGPHKDNEFTQEAKKQAANPHIKFFVAIWFSFFNKVGTVTKSKISPSSIVTCSPRTTEVFS